MPLPQDCNPPKTIPRRPPTGTTNHPLPGTILPGTTKAGGSHPTGMLSCFREKNFGANRCLYSLIQNNFVPNIGDGLNFVTCGQSNLNLVWRSGVSMRFQCIVPGVQTNVGPEGSHALSHRKPAQVQRLWKRISQNATTSHTSGTKRTMFHDN